jgi:hypothetical protein
MLDAPTLARAKTENCAEMSFLPEKANKIFSTATAPFARRFR